MITHIQSTTVTVDHYSHFFIGDEGRYYLMERHLSQKAVYWVGHHIRDL